MTASSSAATTIIERDIIFERKIKLATEGLFKRYFKLLSKLQPKQNAIAIADFIISLNTEINPSTNHKMAAIEALQMLSKRHQIDKSFKDMVRDALRELVTNGTITLAILSGLGIVAIFLTSIIDTDRMH